MSLAVTFQRFQPVARGNPQVLQRPGAMKVQKFPPCDPLKGPKPEHVQVGEQCFRILGPERANHQVPVYYESRNTSSAIALRNGSLPFEELKRRSLINAAAQAADQGPDFSRRIREGLPGARQ